MAHIGIETIGRYAHALLNDATQHMRPMPGVRLIGTAQDKAILPGAGDCVAGLWQRRGLVVRACHGDVRRIAEVSVRRCLRLLVQQPAT